MFSLGAISVFSQALLSYHLLPPTLKREMKAGWGDADNKVVGILMTGFLLPFPLPPFWHSNNDPASFAIWHPLTFLTEKGGGGQNKGPPHPPSHSLDKIISTF